MILFRKECRLLRFMQLSKKYKEKATTFKSFLSFQRRNQEKKITS